MSGSFTVYGLKDPRDGLMFYVGCTRSTDNRRKSHRYGARGCSAYNRVREIRATGAFPEFVVIQDGMEKIPALWKERELILTLPGLVNNKERGFLSLLFFPLSCGTAEVAIEQFKAMVELTPMWRSYLDTW